LPGRSGATRSHCSSLSTHRFKADLQFAALSQISTRAESPQVT
jgi:hypothetical protein